MGNQSSSVKSKSSLFSKRSKHGVSPLMLPKSLKKDLSPQIKSTSMHPNQTIETLNNIGNNSTFSFKTKASTFDQLSENTPRLGQTIPTSEANSNSPTTLEDLDAKKPFQYKKGPPIGQGSIGKVYECLNLSSGELLAVKEVKFYGDITKLQNYVEALKREVTVYKELTHPNVIKYYAIDIYEVNKDSESMIDVISEYISGGSIKVLVSKFDKLDERVISSYTKQILEGLSYLHSQDILHRDMKSSNVLIDACGTAKLTDFGCFKSLAKFVETNHQEYRKSPIPNKPSVYWTAPEVLMKKSQGKPADIWGVGCVVIDMLTGYAPWSNLNSNIDQISKQIISGIIPPIPNTVSEACQDFLNQVFRFRPEDRPTAYELLDHPFIRDSLPSLTCIDMEGSQTLQLSQTGIRSIENIQEDIYSRPSSTSKPQSQNDFIENTPKNYQQEQKRDPKQLSVHVGQSKIIPSRSNKRTNTFTLNQSLNNPVEPEKSILMPKLTIKRVSSQEILRDEGGLTPGKSSDRLNTGPKEHKIIQSPTFKTITKEVSPQEASKYNFNFTPIRNSFFNDRSRKGIPISVPLNNQPEPTPEPITIESRNNVIESQNEVKEKPMSLNQMEEEEKRKMELRRKYEEQMEQELLDMNQSNTSEIWGLRAH